MYLMLVQDDGNVVYFDQRSAAGPPPPPPPPLPLPPSPPNPPTPPTPPAAPSYDVRSFERMNQGRNLYSAVGQFPARMIRSVSTSYISTQVTSHSPTVRGGILEILVDPADTGSGQILFGQAPYGAGAAMAKWAVSRTPMLWDIPDASQGLVMNGRGGSNSGGLSVAVNTGYADLVMGPGKWYAYFEVLDHAALISLPFGFDANKMFELQIQ